MQKCDDPSPVSKRGEKRGGGSRGGGSRGGGSREANESDRKRAGVITSPGPTGGKPRGKRGKN